MSSVGVLGAALVDSSDVLTRDGGVDGRILV